MTHSAPVTVNGRSTLAQIAERLEQEYGVKLTISELNHMIWRGTIRFQRALQILAVCGVTEIEVKSPGTVT